MEMLAWPSWSVAAREDRLAWSMRVAAALRKVWVVTPSKPAVAKASRRSAWVLEGSRQPPSGAGKHRPAGAVTVGHLKTVGAVARHRGAPARQQQSAPAGVA